MVTDHHTRARRGMFELLSRLRDRAALPWWQKSCPCIGPTPSLTPLRTQKDQHAGRRRSRVADHAPIMWLARRLFRDCAGAAVARSDLAYFTLPTSGNAARAGLQTSSFPSFGTGHRCIPPKPPGGSCCAYATVGEQILFLL
jgi:hypothetical protein